MLTQRHSGQPWHTTLHCCKMYTFNMASVRQNYVAVAWCIAQIFSIFHKCRGDVYAI